MRARRCRGCHRQFTPRHPVERYCARCWAIRNNGWSPAWVTQRDLDICHHVDDAIAIDDMRERAGASNARAT